MHTIDGQTITTEQWQLLKAIYTPFREPVAYVNVQKFYEGDPRRMMHDLKELVAKRLVVVNGKQLMLTPVANVTFDPSDVPITPGERRPYVSNAGTEAQDIPETTVKALNKLAKTPVKADKEMVSIVTNSKNLHLNPNETSALQSLVKWGDDEIYSDAYTDWRGRVYHQSSTWGSFQQSRLMRALLATPDRYEVDTESLEYKYFLTIIEGEYDVTEENAQDIYFNARNNGVTSVHEANVVRAAQAVYHINRYGTTNYIMEQDASCSGGQIVALLQGDKDLAAAVNLIPGLARQDLYMIVANGCKESFDRAGITDVTQMRQGAKPVVMLSFYGASTKGIAENVWLEAGGVDPNEDGDFDPDATIDWIGGTFTMKSLCSLIGGLQKGLFDKFPLFARFINMTQAWWSDLPEDTFEWKMEDDADPAYRTAEWTTTTGYFIKRCISVERKAGLMPNFVHSCDASVVQHSLCAADDQDIFLLTVHDAFATKITDGLKIRNIVIEAYQHLARNAYCPDTSERFNFNVDHEMVDNLKDAMVIGEVADLTITA